MVAVYKYRIEDTNQWIEAPVINWLDVGWQDKEQCYVAWALVDTEAADRKFQIIALETGVKIDGTLLDGYQHLGTVNSNYYVLHFFVAEFDPITEKIKMPDVDEINYYEPSDEWISNFDYEVKSNYEKVF